MDRFSRRDFLRGGASAGLGFLGTRMLPGLAVLSALELERCGMLRRPGSRPDPRQPAGTDILPKIEHIVVVMMENHSYDNYLGLLRPRRRPRGDQWQAAQLESGRRRQPHPLVPHARHVSARRRRPQPILEREPHLVRERTQRWLRVGKRRDRHGIPGPAGPAVLLRPREDIPGLRIDFSAPSSRRPIRTAVFSSPGPRRVSSPPTSARF